MNYEEAMEYMDSVSCYGSVLGLENTKELLKRLHDPQDRLRFVHVAGTNGKGSVCTYITSILACAGYRIGRYVSPAVFEYRERIQIIEKEKNRSDRDTKDLSVKYITEEAVAKHLTRIRMVIDAMTKEGLPHPTPFEIETAMAFLEFLEAGCQLVVLEVGMGGRLDSTNVITTTECAVLTSISMDHMAFLGDTLEKIAEEKAGIIKEAIKVVSYEQEPSVRRVIEKKAERESAEVYFADFSKLSEMDYSLSGTDFCYQSDRMGEKLHLKTMLLGENQPKNAALAVEAVLSLKELGYSLTGEQIVEGIRKASWRGRLEIVSKLPLIMADGAHNYDAALSLRRSMEIYFKDRRIFAIVGIFADKEYDKVLSVTLPLVEEVFTITPDNKRALDSGLLAECASKYCKKVTDAGTVAEALQMAKERAGREDVILCFGSLSFLHEVYEWATEQTGR